MVVRPGHSSPRSNQAALVSNDCSGGLLGEPAFDRLVSGNDSLNGGESFRHRVTPGFPGIIKVYDDHRPADAPANAGHICENHPCRVRTRETCVLHLRTTLHGGQLVSVHSWKEKRTDTNSFLRVILLRGRAGHVSFLPTYLTNATYLGFDRTRSSYRALTHAAGRHRPRVNGGAGPSDRC
jgi:hypothetical protein